MIRHISKLILVLALCWPGVSLAQTWYYPGGKTDADFGDGSSSSAWQPSTFNYGSSITLPAGTVTQLGAFVDTGNFASINLKLGLYTSGGSLVVQSSPIAIPQGATLTWRTADVADTAISAGTYYVMGSGSDDNLRYGYDSTGTGSTASATYASSMAASLTINDSETGLHYGVRAEVAAGGEAITPKMMLMGAGP